MLGYNSILFCFESEDVHNNSCSEFGAHNASDWNSHFLDSVDKPATINVKVFSNRFPCVIDFSEAAVTLTVSFYGGNPGTQLRLMPI
jgi:hypothetical protein